MFPFYKEQGWKSAFRSQRETFLPQAGTKVIKDDGIFGAQYNRADILI
jgi:hypothetical protein